MTTSCSPISLFVYNRLGHTRRTVESLAKNSLAKDSKLIIFSDGAKNSDDTDEINNLRSYIKSITGFKSVKIVERNENFGLSKSVISGVTETVEEYGKVIVLEDDIVTSSYFLEYMNEALDLYENEDRVASIHGYIYPVRKPLPETFFLRGADCWGWATWKRAWQNFEPDGKKLLEKLIRSGLEKKFDFDGTYGYTNMLRKQIEGKNNSWAIRWHASAFLKDMFTLYPGISLVENIGHDKTGVHGTQAKFYSTKPSDRKIAVTKIPIEENVNARQIIVDYFRSLRPPLWRRLARRIRSWV